MPNNSPGKEKQNWCGWAPKMVEHKIEFMKKVMENDGHGVDENLTAIQKTFDFAAGCEHHTSHVHFSQ